MTDSSTYIDSLKELQECLVEEDRLEEALSLAEELLLKDDVPPSLLPVLQETRLKLLLHLERFQDILEADNISPSLKTYVYYRLHQYEKSKSSNGEENMLDQHTRAQSLYRLHDKTLLNVYQHLLKETDDSEELLQIQTNALAVAAAHAVPHVNTSNDDDVESFIHTPPQDSSDLLYNLATYQLLTGSSSSSENRSMLQEARDLCEGDDAAAIDVQLHEWSLAFQGLSPEPVEATELPTAVLTVRAVNQATSVTSLPTTCPSNWTALQQRLYYYKRAILQFSEHNFKDCRETCQLLRKSLSLPKRKNAPPPVHSKEQEAWWKAHVNVLEAHCLDQQGKTEQAQSLLKEALSPLENMDASPVVDHAVTHVQLHLFHLNNPASPQATIEMLQTLPTSIQTSKAVTATLVTLYQQVGDETNATKLLQEEGMAEYYMSIGNYEEAVKLYQATDGKEAELVVALSYLDPERANQVWNDMGVNDLPEELNGEELESMDLPRFKSKKTVVETSSTDSKQQKSKESIMRRRARKREEYLKNNPSVANKKLDPERWLPKHERSYYRKRRHARGAQGGTTSRDAAKLDVAARASGQAVDSGPSTAHMGVSSGKRSGRRR